MTDGTQISDPMGDAGDDVDSVRGRVATDPRGGDEGEPGTQRRVDGRLALTLTVGVAGGLLLAQVVDATVERLAGLLITLVVAVFLSLAMEPAVQWLARRGIRRGLATFAVFVAAAMLVAGFVAAMVPLVVAQVSTLVASGPDVLESLARQARTLPPDIGEPIATWLREQRASLPSRLPGLLGDVGRGVLGVGETLLGGVLQTLTLLLVTFYLVADGPRLRRTLVTWLPPRRQSEALAIWEMAIDKTGGYVYSRLVTAVASAIFHIVAFTVIGVPYSVALGVFVGIVSSLIPVVGTYIAGALPIAIALAESPRLALWVLVAVVVYQQIENYLIAPRISAVALELHPAVAFVAVLIGATLLGATGALLALPATAIVAALISASGERHEVMEHGLLAERRPPERGTDDG